MKIKVKTTFRRAFSFMLCMIMLLGIVPFSGFVAVAGDTYTIVCYKSSEEAVVLWEASFKEGEEIDQPDYVKNPTREGHTFKHWSKPIPATMPAEDISTTAQWDINEYTITFNSDGGSAVAPIKQNYNTVIDKPANPSKEGYTFVGWEPAIPDKMPATDMTIKALWKIKKHTITFDSNGGSPVESIEKDYGELITAPTAPTKEGHTFKEWIPALPTSMPDRDMTLKADWIINEYTITFENTGDTVIPPIKQNYNTLIVKPEAPKREGYTFGGWSVAIPDRMPAKDMTIKAEWIPNKIDISYDPNGGYIENIGTTDPDDVTDKPITVSYTYGIPFTAPENSVIDPQNPVRTGSTFLGWYDADGKVRPTDVPSAPTTYYAKWVEGQGGSFYKVNIYRMDELGNYQPAGETLYVGEAGATVTAAGYTIPSGFALDINKSNTSATLTDANGIDNPLQLNVYLKRNEYTITLNGGGGIFNNDENLKTFTIKARYGAVVDVTATLKNVGYTFDGWVNDGSGKPDVIPTIMPATNTSFTAQWVANGNTPYKVEVYYVDATDNDTFKLNEEMSKTYYGTTGAKVKISLTNSPSAEPGVTVHNVSKFDFKHYKVDTSPDAMAQQNLEAVIAANGSTVLKLIYIPVNYKVTFTVAGKVYATEEVRYHDSADTVEPTVEEMNAYFATEMPGYTFKGWDPDTSDEVIGDVTYKATYNSNPYTVTFRYVKLANDGSEATTEITPDSGILKPFTQDFNTEYIIPKLPTKAGYKCDGWFEYKYTEDNEKIKIKYLPGQVEMIPVNGLNLVAEFKAISYEIKFDSNLIDATIVAPISAYCDDDVTIPEYPTKEGCKCVGWYAADGTRYEPGDKLTMPAGGTTLTAEWDIGKFNIIYYDFETAVDKDKNGTIELEEARLYQIEKMDISCDEKITAPDYLTNYNGKTFVGWRERGKSGFFTHDKMPGYSVRLEAVWGYTITFVDDNGAILKREALEHGAAVTAPTIPYKIGTTALGWAPSVPETMPNHDVVIKVNRMYNDYTITYMNGDKVYKQETYKYGQTISPVEAPRKCFKAFEGWDAEIPATMPDHDITVSAVWSNNTNFVKAIQSFFGTLVNIFNMILKIFS